MLVHNIDELWTDDDFHRFLMGLLENALGAAE